MTEVKEALKNAATALVKIRGSLNAIKQLANSQELDSDYKFRMDLERAESEFIITRDFLSSLTQDTEKLQSLEMQGKYQLQWKRLETSVDRAAKHVEL